MANKGGRIILGDNHDELRSYLTLPPRVNEFFGYEIFLSWQAPESLDQFLDRQRVNVLLIQPGMMRDLKVRPEASQLLERPEALGWRRLAPADRSDGTWLLLYREPRV